MLLHRTIDLRNREWLDHKQRLKKFIHGLPPTLVTVEDSLRAPPEACLPAARTRA